jgi:regulatory protein
LRAKGFSAATICPVLEALTEEGLISDRRFAETLVRRRAEQGYGLLRIRAELRQLGVDATELDWPEVDWEAILLKAYRKRYGATEPASMQALSARRRFLLQRGFTAEQIHRLLHVHERLDSHSDLVY